MTVETVWAKALDCYYGTSECSDDLWQCQTCKEWFCDIHSHETALGCRVECVACERDRVQGYPAITGIVED